GNLFHDEFGVRKHMELLTAGKDSETEHSEERRIFGKVVRSCSEVFSNARNAGEEHADAGLAGIAARSSVDVGLEPHASSNGWSRFSGSYRMRWQASQAIIWSFLRISWKT